MNGKSIVALVVGITVALLVIGYLLPAGFTAYHDTSETYTNTLTVALGPETIGQGITINLTAVNAATNATCALYEFGVLIDTQTIDLDATGTFTAPGGSVTVTPTEIGASSATVSTVIPTYYNWDTAETSIFGVLGLLVLLGLMLAILAFAIDAYS